MSTLADEVLKNLFVDVQIVDEEPPPVKKAALNGRGSKYKLGDLNVGQGKIFTINRDLFEGEEDFQKKYKSIYSVLSNSCRQISKRTGAKFTIRKLDKDRIGVWRLT